MYVAIDTSPMQEGHKGRGIGNYTKLLKEALQKVKSDHSFYFFTRGEKLPENVDLVHYTYYDPFFLTLPLAQTSPFVVTVHDLIPLVYPEAFPRGVRGELKWLLQKKALENASRILTDSKASKTDIHNIIGFKSEKIDVVYLAPSPVFKKITDKKLLRDVKQRYSLPKKFILYVGDVNWNKNIPGLLDAFAEVSKTFQDINLILVGKSFLDNQLPEVTVINNKIHELHVENSIKKLGFISDEHLSALYSLATVYVQPSFAEGFGFPVLEAMACGCPVVTSRTSSLSEIAGPSVLVDPNDASSIANGMMTVLRSKNYNKLSQLASSWAKKFTWDRVAKETIATYERALERT